ncbi:MAG: hypothetical protein NC099_06460, partial [Corallococcus sp.]|nr:hypothetical protein [Corallococcus sp.]
PAATSTAYPKDPLKIVSVSKKVGTSTSNMSPLPANTEKVDGTLDIKLTDAGEYTITFGLNDTTNYEWSGTDKTSNKTLTITLKPKQLSIAYTTYDEKDAAQSGEKLSWSATDGYYIVFKISGVVHDATSHDDVGIVLSFTKENDSTFQKVSATAQYDSDSNDGAYKVRLDNTLFADSKYAKGTYPLSIAIEGSNGDNSNYSLSDALNTFKNKKLSITSAGIDEGSESDPTYVWKYTTYKGSDAQGAASALGTLTYTLYDDNNTAKAIEYVLELDETVLASKHISIDKSKWTNGYKDNRISTAGDHTITVYLKADDGYEFEESGTKSSTKEYTYKVSIAKMTADMSKVKWEYKQGSTGTAKEYPADGLPWINKTYTLSITGLPLGVTVTTSDYTGNTGKNVNTYNASCSLTYDTDNIETITAPTISWKISKAKIEITGSTSWESKTMPEGETDESKQYSLPQLKVPTEYNGAIEYEYYYLGTEEDPKSPAEKLASIADIKIESGTVNKYYVKAVVSSKTSTDGSSKWSDVLEIVDNTTPDNGKCTKSFSTGDDKTAITVELAAKNKYNGKDQAKVGSDLKLKIAENEYNGTVNVKYYKYDASAKEHKGTPLAEGTYPKNVGKYVVELTLDAEEAESYYIDGSLIEYEIELLELNIPQEGTDTFSGKEQELITLSGLDKEGLNVYYKIAVLTWYDSKNTPHKLDPSEIDKCVNSGSYEITYSLTDTSNVKWSDNGSLSTGNKTCKVTVERLKLTVTGWQEVSNGTEPYIPVFADSDKAKDLWENEYYTAEGTKIEDDWRNHYLETLTQKLTAGEGNEENVEIEYSEGTDKEKTFSIPEDPSNPLGEIEKPKYEEGTNTGTYTGKEQEYTPEGLKDLLNDGKVKLYAVDEEGNEREVDKDYFKQKDAGKYKVKAVIEGPYKWSDTQDKSPVEYEFEVEPAEIEPVWTLKDGKPQATLPEGIEAEEEVFEYHYYDSEGNEVAEDQLQPNTEYKVTASVKEEYKKNIVLKNADGKEEVESTEPYTTPKGFFEQELLGLPLWVWLIILVAVIGLATLLIILLRKRAKANAMKKAEAEKLAAEEEEKAAAEAEKAEQEPQPQQAQTENTAAAQSAPEAQPAQTATQPATPSAEQLLEQQMMAQRMQMQQQMMAQQMMAQQAAMQQPAQPQVIVVKRDEEEEEVTPTQPQVIVVGSQPTTPRRTEKKPPSSMEAFRKFASGLNNARKNDRDDED